MANLIRLVIMSLDSNMAAADDPSLEGMVAGC